MNTAAMLSLLKVDLGIVTTIYDERLTCLLDAAKGYIETEGVSLSPEISIDDANLIIMYAAYLWRRRDMGDADGQYARMPRMLRWALNNRIFAEKMREP